mgnify:FL=1
MIMLANDIAQELHARGIGIYTTDNPSLRTIFVGDFPVIQNPDGTTSAVEGITVMPSASPLRVA